MPRDRRIADGEGLLRELRRRGFAASPTSNGHYMVTGPAGIATVSLKWDDWRDRDNTLADLRRHAGIDVTEPVPETRPPRAPSEAPPPKLQLPGPRPTLAYDKITEPEDMSTRNGSPPAASPANGTDHETLLAMLAEASSQIAKLESRIKCLETTGQRLAGGLDASGKAFRKLDERLKVAENSIDAVAIEVAGMKPSRPTDDRWLVEMRAQVTAVLSRFRDLGVYLPRATIAEVAGISSAGDDPESKRLSYALRLMRDEGLVESTGAKSATRWRLVQAPDERNT